MRLPIIIISLIVGAVFTSCTEKSVDVDNLTAIGGKKYGGDFRFMSAEKVNSLATISSVDHYSSRLVSQIYEPLLKIDVNSMGITPAVAESYTVSDDATVYTFKVRKGILFHQDDALGKKRHELTAEDVKFSLEMACSNLELNQISYLLVKRIKGAKEFFDNSSESLPKEGVSGIKIINGNSVEITLVSPFAGFENILTHSSLGIFPREVYEKYGDKIGEHPVGSGPFELESITDDKIVLKRNSEYWRKDDFGNQLPYLGRIVMTYAENKRSELLAFRKSEVDLVLEIPVEEVEHILGTLIEAQEGKNIKHKIESESSMSISYIGMADGEGVFNNIQVRKAFNLAINRDEIVDVALEGEGWASHNGFVPKMMNYPTEKVVGYTFNVPKAQNLMKLAGYPNGKGFPEIDFYVNAVEGSKTHKYSSAIAAQLQKNLGVKLNIKLVTIDERNKAILSGEAKIWAEGWLADYPDPENFLLLLYGGNVNDHSSYSNRFKFNNAKYDALFEKAIAETNPEKRTELLLKCDQLIIDEAAIMPIYTDDNTVMVNARVRDFKVNEMESLNLTHVFIKEPKKK
ncbi:MAG: ABC transporter substrate-binding protein [Fluviicola sp.]|nr:ABC transporter substrate-binding protein [Fluviicola sp.]